MSRLTKAAGEVLCWLGFHSYCRQQERWGDVFVCRRCGFRTWW